MALFVPRIGANHVNTPFSAHYFAIFADFPDTRADFHGNAFVDSNQKFETDKYRGLHGKFTRADFFFFAKVPNFAFSDEANPIYQNRTFLPGVQFERLWHGVGWYGAGLRNNLTIIEFSPGKIRANRLNGRFSALRSSFDKLFRLGSR